MADSEDQEHIMEKSQEPVDVCPPDSKQIEQNNEDNTALIEVRFESPDNGEHTEEPFNTVTVYQPEAWHQPQRAAKKKALDRCKKIAVHDQRVDIGYSVRSTCRKANNAYYCEHCSYRVGKHDLMQSHYRKEHPTLAKMHKCIYDGCDYSCNCRKSMSAHILAIHKNAKFKCTHEDCTFETNSRTKLRYHMKSKHLTLEEFKPWKCSECELRFCHTHDLDRHYYVRHMPDKPYSCDEEGCTYKCKSTWELRSHKSQSHSDVKPYKCGQCGLRTKVLSDLRKHMIRHLNVREHQCGVCDKKFVCAGDAKKHREDIHSDLNIKCEHCPYIAKSKFKYRNHLKKHSSNWFSCAHCSQKYHSKALLKQHIRTHDPNRPFPCPICEEYVATSLFTLVVHIGKIHKDYRCLYECIICKRSYHKSAKLKQHFRSDLHKMAKAANPALRDEPDDPYTGLMEKLYSVNGMKKTTKKKEKYKWEENLKGPRPKFVQKVSSTESKAPTKKPLGRKRKAHDKDTKSCNKKRKVSRSKQKKQNIPATSIKEEPENSDHDANDNGKKKQKADNCYASMMQRKNTDQIDVQSNSLKEGHLAESSTSSEKLLSDFVSNTDVGTLENVVVKIEKDDGEQEVYGFQVVPSEAQDNESD